MVFLSPELYVSSLHCTMPNAGNISQKSDNEHETKFSFFIHSISSTNIISIYNKTHIVLHICIIFYYTRTIILYLYDIVILFVIHHAY